jgi:hypothetical protein
LAGGSGGEIALAAVLGKVAVGRGWGVRIVVMKIKGDGSLV